MASLIRRSNGIFYVVSMKKGRRVWRSLVTRDDGEARSLFEKEDLPRRNRSLTLSSFWVSTKAIIETECTIGTVLLYDHAVKELSRVVGEKRLSAYSVLDFERFKVRRASRVSKLTVNKELRILRALFQRAITFGYIEDNAARKCKLLKIDGKRPQYFTIDEFIVLLRVITDQDFKDFVIFTLNTALRSGEAAYLDWSDIDVSSEQFLVRNKPEHRVKNGKERFEPLNDTALAVLSRRAHKSRWVFTRPDGRPYSVKYVSDKFRKLRRKAKLPEGLRFHSLRHTSLTWLHHNGVPVESTRQIAGHSSIQTTQIYTHALPQHLLAAVNTLVPQHSEDPLAQAMLPKTP